MFSVPSEKLPVKVNQRNRQGRGQLFNGNSHPTDFSTRELPQVPASPFTPTSNHQGGWSPAVRAANWRQCRNEWDGPR